MRLSRLHNDHDVDPREIDQRSFAFSVATMRLTQELSGKLPEPVLNHLTEEGTAVGANVAEALQGNSRRLYLNRMTAARHASQRVQFWLQLIGESEAVPREATDDLIADAQALQTTLNTLCLRARQTAEGE